MLQVDHGDFRALLLGRNRAHIAGAGHIVCGQFQGGRLHDSGVRRQQGQVSRPVRQREQHIVGDTADAGMVEVATGLAAVIAGAEKAIEHPLAGQVTMKLQVDIPDFVGVTGPGPGHPGCPPARIGQGCQGIQQPIESGGVADIGQALEDIGALAAGGHRSLVVIRQEPGTGASAIIPVQSHQADLDAGLIGNPT